MRLLQQAGELKRWCTEEKQRAEEERKEIAEKEKNKNQADVEKAEASRRIAEMASYKRVTAEMKELSTENDSDQYKYKRYTIEEIEEATEFFSQSRKIGEGGYGPVFKARLSNTPVAIKVLRPDAAQGWSQFQQEVKIPRKWSLWYIANWSSFQNFIYFTDRLGPIDVTSFIFRDNA